MEDNFNTYIRNIDFDTWRQFCTSRGALRSFAKGEEFVSIGSVGRYIGFLAEGALKYVVRATDGTEHVMGLVFGESFVADWPFCLYSKPARLAITAVTDCKIYCIPTKAVKELMDSEPRFRERVMRSTEEVYSMVYDRYLDLYCKSPQERYDQLISLHPNLFDIFSLKDIASFLNITPTHLSRIRRKPN